MSTPTVPTTGMVSLSNIISSFPNQGSNLSNFYNKHPSLPASGLIGLSNFRGLTAVSPTHTLSAVSGTNMSMNASGSITGTVGASQTGILSVNFQSYVSNASFQGTLTYTVISGSLPTGVSLSSAGALSVNTTTATAGTVSVTVRATNSYGNTSSISLSFNFTAASSIPVTSGLIAQYTGESWNGTQWTDLIGTNHATTVSGTITKNNTGINGRAFISGNTSSVIQFPAAILPSTYTLFHVTRYNGTNNGRIVAGNLDGASAWLSGFWANSTGVAFHGAWLNLNNIGHSGFFLSTDQNNLYRSNGVQRGTVTGGTSRNIGINFYAAERSDWACACVFVYNRTLSLSEMQQMETYINGLYALY